MLSNTAFRLKSGFTLLEIVVALSILILLGILVTTTFSNFKKKADLNSAAENGVSLLIQTRSKTLSSQAASRYGVHFEPGRMVLFKGADFSEGEPNNEEALLGAAVEISDISLGGGGTDVVFKRLTGATDNYGSITFRLKSNPTRTRTINILITGGVNL